MIKFIKKILRLGLGDKIVPVPLDLLKDNLIGHYFRNKVSGEFIYIYSAVTKNSFEPMSLDIIDRINNLSDQLLETDIRKSRPIGPQDPDSFHVAPRSCMPSLERTKLIEDYDHCDLKKIFAPESPIEDWHTGLQQFKYITDICINNFRRRRDEIKNRTINNITNQAQVRLNEAYSNLNNPVNATIIANDNRSTPDIAEQRQIAVDPSSTITDSSIAQIYSFPRGLQAAAQQVRNRNNYTIAIDPTESGSVTISTTSFRPAVVPPPDPTPEDPIEQLKELIKKPLFKPEAEAEDRLDKIIGD